MFVIPMRSFILWRAFWLAGVLVAASIGCDATPAKSPAPATSAADAASNPVSTSLSSTVPSPIRFIDRTGRSEIDCVYRNGEERGYAGIIESLGGGVALFDYDNDGDVDLFAPGGGEFGANREIAGLPSALYRNDGDWRFANVTNSAGVGQPRHYTHGVAVSDADNDGFADFVVTGYGGVQFFRNQGDGSFEDGTAPAGLTDPLWSSSAAWGDLNGDGCLDLYIVHYVNWSWDNDPPCLGPRPDLRDVCPPRQFDGLPDTLYFANGDGTFTDHSQAAGLRPGGKGLSALLGDIDLDGDLDMYIANDNSPKFLYRNRGAGVFDEIGQVSGAALNEMGTPDGSMGIALADLTLDGLPDLWVANYERESFALYRNDGDCNFQHASQAMGITEVGSLFVGFGTFVYDFDRDGDEDIFVSNGHVIKYPANAPVRQLPLLFENLNGKRFRNIAPTAGNYLAEPHLGRGAARGDIDGDGDDDMALSPMNEPLALLENATRTGNAWLRIRLIGTTSNRDAIGARLMLETSAGKQYRQVVGGESYLSHSDHCVDFGIPVGVQLMRLTVHWPAGVVTQRQAPELNSRITLIEPSP